METTTFSHADFVPYPIVHSPDFATETAPPEPTQRAIDERFPYLQRGAEDPTININGFIPFLTTLVSRVPNLRGRLKKNPIQSKFQKAWCRHLVAQHWVNSRSGNGNHRALDLFNSPDAIWWKTPDFGNLLDAKLALFTSKAHLLPAHLLGKLLSQEFQSMLEEPEASPDDATRSRFYAVATHVHVMSLELRLTRDTNKEWAFHVSFYDPNTSLYTVDCKPEKLEDLTTFQSHYHFLSFLISENDDPTAIKLKKYYFYPADNEHNIAIIELLVPDPNPPTDTNRKRIDQWTTNWCTNSLMELTMSIKLPFKEHAEESLLKALPENDAAPAWESLQGASEGRPSYLCMAMTLGSVPAMERWERLWAQQSDDDRVLGLDGLDFVSQHVVSRFPYVSLACRQKWFEMVSQLRPDLQRRVIAGESHLVNRPLICTLLQGGNDPTLLQSFFTLLAQAAEGQTEHLAKLLQAHDHKGRSALELSLRKGNSNVRAAWVDELSKLPRADMVQVLAGVHRDGTPLWARLLQALDLLAMAELSRLYSKLGLTAADLEPHVALPDCTPMAQRRWTRAMRHRDNFRHTFDFIEPFLPAPIRDQVTQWLTNTCLSPGS